MITALVVGIVVGTTAWVAVDSRTWRWPIGCAVFWIIGFPSYLRHRRWRDVGREHSLRLSLGWGAALGVASFGILAGLTATSYNGPPAGTFESELLGQLRATGSNGFGVTSAGSVDCPMPGRWAPGTQFSCYVYSRRSTLIGTTTEDIVPPPPGSGDTWYWVSHYFPT